MIRKGKNTTTLYPRSTSPCAIPDPDAAVYWLARMLEAGEDPLYVASRLVRFASEDIGMADSQALTLAVSAYQACHFLGMPECNVHLSHAVIYLSMAPKSNSAYMAYESAKADAQNMLAEPVPLNIRNAPTGLMKGSALWRRLRVCP